MPTFLYGKKLSIFQLSDFYPAAPDLKKQRKTQKEKYHG